MKMYYFRKNTIYIYRSYRYNNTETMYWGDRMPRPKVKDYKVVVMSLSTKALEILDMIRGELSRTEFIERLVLSHGKDKAELLTRIAELERQVEELRKENEKLREQLDARKRMEEEMKKLEEIDKRKKELLRVYMDGYKIWRSIDTNRAKAWGVYSVIEHIKKEGRENDEITRIALEKLLKELGLQSYLSNLDAYLSSQ